MLLDDFAGRCYPFYEVMTMSIGKNLRQIRLSRGMTQEEVAGQVGLTRQALSSYESERTQPDVEMLIKLAEVYGTDLEGVLYGTARGQKELRWVKRTALVVLILMMLLSLIGSALYWSAHVFFPIDTGADFSDSVVQVVWERHKALTRGWELLEGAALTLSRWGPAVLLVMLLCLKCAVPMKQKLIYAGTLIGGLFLVTLPFALTDPLFGPVNYLYVCYVAAGRVLFFLLIGLIVDWVRRRKKKF